MPGQFLAILITLEVRIRPRVRRHWMPHALIAVQFEMGHA